MSGNDESSSRDFGDSFQLTNWILDTRVTCHMTPQVTDFISGSLENTDIYWSCGRTLLRGEAKRLSSNKNV